MNPSHKKTINHLNSDFFNLQFTVRRFYKESPDDYEKVVRIYRAFENFVLENTSVSFSCDAKLLSIYSDPLPLCNDHLIQAFAIYKCMGLFETDKRKHAIRDRNIDFLFEAFFDDSNYIQDKSDNKIKRQFIANLFELLKEHIDTVEELQKKYNYFDYFSVYSMSLKCSFDEIYKAYIAQYHLLTEEDKLLDQTDTYNRWIVELPLDEHPDFVRLYFFVCFSPEPKQHFQSGRTYFRPASNDKPETAFLEVFIENGAQDIDPLLGQFKSLVTQRMNRLIENSVGESFCFFNSDFYKSRPKFSTENGVTQSDSVLVNILGLWCWDNYMEHGKSGTNLETIFDEVQEGRIMGFEPFRKNADKISNKKNSKEPVDKSSALKSNYSKVKALIDGENNNGLEKLFIPHIGDNRLGKRS